MGRAIFTKIIVTVVGSSIGGAIILLFGLDRVIANLARDEPTLVAGILLLLVGLAGAVALGAWVAFGIEEKLLNKLSPRPKLGSLSYKLFEPNLSVFHISKRTDAGMVLQLHNSNSDLLSYRARLSGTVNGKEFRTDEGLPILEFEGYATANQDATLLLHFFDVPMPVKDGWAMLEVTFRYDVEYFYAPAGRRKRRTAKTIRIVQPIEVTGTPRGPIPCIARFEFWDQSEE